MTLNKIKNKLIRLYISLKKETPLQQRARFEFVNFIKKNNSKYNPDYGEWNKYIQRFRVYALKNDPRSFLRWNPITESMFCSGYKIELDYILQSKNKDLWLDAIKETWVGHPPKYKYYKKSSGSVIHTAYNLYRIIDKYQIDITKLNNIIEFGGGYGAMSKTINNLGFAGKYIIFDIPEFLALQKYYLVSTDTPGNFFFIDKIYDIEITDPDMFIATWSISEAPISVRKEFIKKIGSPKYILIAYQKVFNSIDNLEYFESFKKTMPEYEWTNDIILHIPENYYLLGRKK